MEIRDWSCNQSCDIKTNNNLRLANNRRSHVTRQQNEKQLSGPISFDFVVVVIFSSNLGNIRIKSHSLLKFKGR